MDHLTISAYDRASAQYAQDWRQQPTPDDMYELLREHFSPGPTADIGSGNGRDVAWLRANGFDACGYDASEGLLNEARAASPEARFGLACLPELAGVPRGAYANVLCETVLMHLSPEDVPAASRALMDLLRPGGVLYVSWRVTRNESIRDDNGRLYAAFDRDAVVAGLGPDVEIFLDREALSPKSGKTIHRLIVRKPG
jgi:SAM-dependent methyltransferase